MILESIVGFLDSTADIIKDSIEDSTEDSTEDFRIVGY